MGFLGKLFGKKDEEAAVELSSAVTQQPVYEEKLQTIDMSKHNENLGKVLIDMSKGSKIDMTKHTARVALAMDYSGSMDWLYDNGSVQETISRLLPIALRFDDNGELESWLFSNGAERLKAANADNYSSYVKNVMKKAHMYMGGTNYAPVLKEMVTYYKDIEPSEIPAFIIFITDGENSDTFATNAVIKELSEYNIFVQFIGIGDEDFDYLKSLDDMKGRKHDNTGFTAVKDMSKNQKISMVKEDGTGIKNFFIGVNWDQNRYAGEADIDFDINGFLTDSSRKVVYPEDLVNYKTYEDGSAYPWVDYSGDNKTGDDSQGMIFNGKHYDEYFIVHADTFPKDKTEFTICLTIFRALQRMQNFGMVSNAVMTICDYDNPDGDKYEYDLSENENFEKLNAVEMGKLYRYGDGFKFQALGSGYVGGMTELFKNFGLDIDEGRD